MVNIDILIKQNGFLIKELIVPAGTYSIGDHYYEWSGKDNNGNLVADGNYQFEVIATDTNCMQSIAGNMKVVVGGEYNCPADRICINKMKNPVAAKVGGKAQYFFRAALVNNTASVANLKKVPLYFNVGGDWPSLTPDQGLFNASGQPNYTLIRWAKDNTDNTFGGTLLGPSELNVGGDNNDFQQSNNFGLTGFVSFDEGAKVITSIRMDIANVSALQGQALYCSVPDFGKFVSETDQSLTGKVVTTPKYLGQVGMSLPSDHVIYSDTVVIQ